MIESTHEATRACNQEAVLTRLITALEETKEALPVMADELADMLTDVTHRKGLLSSDLDEWFEEGGGGRMMIGAA